MTRICKLFELLGIFLAKCFQDGRRIDIPLANSFLKLLCSTQDGLPTSYTRKSVSVESNIGSEDNNNEEEKPISPANAKEEISTDDNCLDNTQLNRTTDEVEGATGKERLIMVDVEKEEEVSRKDGSKEDVLKSEHTRLSHEDPLRSTLPWFTGILTINDLRSVDPYRGKFLVKLEEFITLKSSILNDSSLSQREKNQKVKEMVFDGNSQLEEMM